MKVEFFIDRPIFSAVLSILIVVVGCIRPLFVAGGSIPADYTSYGENFGLLSRG